MPKIVSTQALFETTAEVERDRLGQSELRLRLGSAPATHAVRLRMTNGAQKETAAGFLPAADHSA